MECADAGRGRGLGAATSECLSCHGGGRRGRGRALGGAGSGSEVQAAGSQCWRLEQHRDTAWQSRAQGGRGGRRVRGSMPWMVEES